MKSKGGFQSRGRRPHGAHGQQRRGGGGGGHSGSGGGHSGGPPRPHHRRGPGRPMRPTTQVCPMCGAEVNDLAGHVRSKHDDADSHPRD